MSITRRDVLKFGLAGAAGLLLPNPLKAATASVAASPRQRKTFPIVQGATDDTKTQFSVVHSAKSNIFAAVTLPDGREVAPDKFECFRHPGQATAVTQFFFSRLEPGADMKLSISNSSRKVLDSRVFRTLDPGRSTFKFAICSCMDDRHHDPAIWNDLVSQRPDVIFFIGDSVYTDSELQAGKQADPAKLWRRFAESRTILEIYHQPRLIPLLAVWDDHDFGKNDTNSVEYPYVRESKKNFLTYFPQNPDYCRFLERGPGISSAFSFRGQQVILMDDRYFRQPSNPRDRYGHWGKAQEEWALRQIRSHRSATWLMNGSQFFPSVMWKESLSRDHEAQFSGFVSELRGVNRKVLFASGDVHYSEVSRIEESMLGYETFEVTSSSIHSTSVPGFPALVPNRRRILSTGKRNYVTVEARKEKYLVESRNPAAGLLFRKEIRF